MQMRNRRSKQRGFWNFALPALASAGAAIVGSYIGSEGQEDTNAANTNINNAQMAFNREEAQKNRDFQDAQRHNQYQVAMQDMQRAGLNPMLAYQNGGARPTSGAQAASGSMIPMGNTAQAGINGAIAAAQIANTHSQTKVNEAQAKKIEAEVPNVEASTKVLNAQLPKITAEIDKLVEEKQVLIKEGWNKTDIGNLIRAQEAVARVEKLVKLGELDVQDALNALRKAETTLRKLEVPGAQNQADFEKATATGEGASGAAKTLLQILQGLRTLTGK